MKAKRYWILAVLLAMSLAGVWAVRSFAELTDKQLSLNEIKTLYVFVQGFTAETKTAGLKKGPLQNYVEAKLKAVVIKIVSEEETLDVPGRPVLYVNISARKRKEVAAFIYHIDVGILQEVALVRDPSIHTMSITWNKGSLGHCPVNTLPSSIRGTVGYLMDKFVNDYKAANPGL